MTCCKHTAGDLTAKITIQRKTTAPDGMGGAVDTWADIATPFAKWAALSGSELWRAQRLSPTITARAVIRFRGDAYGAPYYAPSDRVMYRNREYAVSAVIDADDGQKWLELYLSEGVAS